MLIISRMYLLVILIALHVDFLNYQLNFVKLFFFLLTLEEVSMY